VSEITDEALQAKCGGYEEPQRNRGEERQRSDEPRALTSLELKEYVHRTKEREGGFP